LKNALRANVNPGPGSHLPKHNQAFLVQDIEIILRCPMGHQVRICDQYARRVRVALENRHRFAGLNQQRLIIFQVAQRLEDSVKGFPIARGLSSPPIDHQILGAFGHFRI
jgi:hypothetical protein